MIITDKSRLYQYEHENNSDRFKGEIFYKCNLKHKVRGELYSLWQPVKKVFWIFYKQTRRDFLLDDYGFKKIGK